MTILTGPGLEDFAATAAGPLVTVADRSWPRDGSRVWELTSAGGERFYLKQHQTQLFHKREVTAYRLWTSALGTGRAPQLLAADGGLRAVVHLAEPGFNLGPVRSAMLAAELLLVSPGPAWRKNDV